MYIRLIVVRCMLMVLFVLGPTYKALHMFQQNRYEAKRFNQWLKNNAFKNKTVTYLALLTIILFVFLQEYINTIQSNLVMLLIFALWGIATFKNALSDSVIPLKFTARVFRQLFVISLLHLVWIVYVSLQEKLMLTQAFVIGFYGTWLLIFLMHAITLPIEEMNKNRYKKMAHNILLNHRDLKTIAITGSFGKTSTKMIMFDILSEKYYTLVTPNSYNTPMGITRTVRSFLKPIHDYFICEMGADKVGDIQELCDLVPLKMGVVTSIGPQHLNTFGTLDNIINEKMKLIENLGADGVGFINVDNDYIRTYSIKNTCKIVTFGINNDADFMAKDISFSHKGSSFTVVAKGEEAIFETQLLGVLNVSNVLASVAVAMECGLTLKECQKAAKKVQQIEHRLQNKQWFGLNVIDNAFNSNTIGSKASLDVLQMMENKRFIMTPGMIDLGDKQDEYNRDFGRYMLDRADCVVLVGEHQTKPILEGLLEVGFNKDNIHVVETAKDGFALLQTLMTKDDIVLVENDLPDAFNN